MDLIESVPEFTYLLKIFPVIYPRKVSCIHPPIQDIFMKLNL